MNETRFRIRKAEGKDLPGIMEIYAGAREFMAEHGNPRQWGNTNWPPEALIRKDPPEPGHGPRPSSFTITAGISNPATG